MQNCTCAVYPRTRTLPKCVFPTWTLKMERDEILKTMETSLVCNNTFRFWTNIYTTRCAHLWSSLYYCVKNGHTLKSQCMFATNILFLKTLEETKQSFSNTSDLLYQMFRSPNPSRMRAGISVRNRQASEAWHGPVSGCTYRFSPGLDWSEYAAASPPMLDVGIYSEVICICCSHQLLGGHCCL